MRRYFPVTHLAVIYEVRVLNRITVAVVLKLSEREMSMQQINEAIVQHLVGHSLFTSVSLIQGECTPNWHESLLYTIEDRPYCATTTVVFVHVEARNLITGPHYSVSAYQNHFSKQAHQCLHIQAVFFWTGLHYLACTSDRIFFFKDFVRQTGARRLEKVPSIIIFSQLMLKSDGLDKRVCVCISYITSPFHSPSETLSNCQ